MAQTKKKASSWTEGERVEEEKEEVVEDAEVEENDEVETGKVLDGVKITIDTPTTDVISYDQRGEDLQFMDSLDEFKELPDVVVRELSQKNRERYFLAMDTHRRHVDEEEMPKIENLQIDMEKALANSKLDVAGKNPKMHYAWRRPDQVRRDMLRGYRMCQDERVNTMISRSSSLHTVSAMGEDELYLMEIPKEKKKALDQLKKKRSEIYEKGPEENFKRETGRLAYDGRTDRRVATSPPVDENGAEIYGPR